MTISCKSCSALSLDRDKYFNYLKGQNIVMASADICLTLGSIHSERQRLRFFSLMFSVIECE